MTLNIRVTSEKKGSNPGGRCSLPYQKAELDAYLKYCNHSEIRGSPFRSSHQPIYEVLTVHLAERLGLEVPRVFLLENSGREKVAFEYEGRVSATERLDDNRSFYFLSKMARTPTLDGAGREVLSDRVARGKLFRDLLMIGDISKREHNYTLFRSGDDAYVFYIDLGCSFVDAYDGRLTQRNSIAQLIRTNGGSQGLNKDLRMARQYLSKKGLITCHREPHKEEILCLDKVVDEVPVMRLPLFPYGSREVRELLCEEEVEQIRDLLLLNMERTMRHAVKGGLWNDHIIS